MLKFERKTYPVFKDCLIQTPTATRYMQAYEDNKISQPMILYATIKFLLVKHKGLSEGILLDRNEWRKLIHVPDPT